MYRETGFLNIPAPTVQDDAALLADVQRGDEQAMAVLFDRYSKIVYSVSSSSSELFVSCKVAL